MTVEFCIMDGSKISFLLICVLRNKLAFALPQARIP